MAPSQELHTHFAPMQFLCTFWASFEPAGFARFVPDMIAFGPYRRNMTLNSRHVVAFSKHCLVEYCCGRSCIWCTRAFAWPAQIETEMTQLASEVALLIQSANWDGSAFTYVYYAFAHLCAAHSCFALSTTWLSRLTTVGSTNPRSSLYLAQNNCL